MAEEKTYTLTINSENLNTIIAKRTKNIDNLISEFMEKYYKTKIDRLGNVINDTNPLLISTYFFKSINPMGNVEPVYTSEQLSKVYDLYCFLIEKVNMEVGIFQPTISHFCKFAGISLVFFQNLKNSIDKNMRILVEKINTETFDANMTLTQQAKLSERPTTFRMKVENEVVENKTPNINVNLSAKTVDLDKINTRLREIKALTKKQITFEE